MLTTRRLEAVVALARQLRAWFAAWSPELLPAILADGRATFVRRTAGLHLGPLRLTEDERHLVYDLLVDPDGLRARRHHTHS